MTGTADLASLRIQRDAAPPPGRRHLLRLAPVLLVLVVIGGVAAFAVTHERAIPVRTQTVTLRGTAGGAGGIAANGYVVARTKASVSSKLAGRLTYLGVEEGDQVAAGAVIARLESAEFEAAVHRAAADVLAAEAGLHEATADHARAVRALERARSLAAGSLIATETLEDAETALQVAASRLDAARARREAARQIRAAAEANLESTRIRAPFAGTVLRKDAEVGEVVAPSVAGGGLTRGAVVTMADLSTLEVEVDVNEAYIAGIARDQAASIVLDAYPGVAFPGRVRQVVPTADRQRATVLVRVGIDSRDPRILPEMGARVVFLDDAAAPAGDGTMRRFVPASAVRAEGAESVVYVVADARAHRRVVDAAPVSGSEREVRSGLSGGETVIVDLPDRVADGTKVRADNPSEGRP